MKKEQQLTNTPHINLLNEIGFAKTVLMPGDPKRAEWIANTFLDNPVLINSVRNMYAYTGTYKEIPISVMGSGMGMPSIAIYATELYSRYDVENIIRVGTAGAIMQDVRLNDIIIAMGASTNSAWQDSYIKGGHFAPIADYNLLESMVQIAKENNVEYIVGNVLSDDNYYGSNTEQWKQFNVLAADMETAALYIEASRCNKSALTVLSVSDIIGSPHEQLTAEQKETGLETLVTIALETAVNI